VLKNWCTGTYFKQRPRVNSGGDISWHKGDVFVCEMFRNEEIGLEQMDEDVRRFFFCNTELGEFNIRR
jgi:N-dimethylarginine dimethylaminohydrolase